MPPEIILTDAPDAAAREVILAGLAAFNATQAGPPELRPLAALITDPATGAVSGGLWGRTAWQWLFVDLLFVPAALRGSGIGTALIRAAEAEALRRGCIGAWLDTFSYQAPEFYRRLGYTEFGRIADYPPGHERVFFSRRLAG